LPSPALGSRSAVRCSECRRDDVVVAPNLFIIVEANLNVPISETLVRARGAEGISG
jgi:hypothetical protein